MKRVVSRFLIVFGLVALWASTSREAMQFLSYTRDVNKWWGTYQCLNGDLVSMSYLDFVHQFNPGPERQRLKTFPQNTGNTALYIDGDSYTWHLGDSNFSQIKSLVYINRDHGCNYHLDTAVRNVFIIEISERFVWDYFRSARIFDEVCDSPLHQKKITFNDIGHRAHLGYASFTPGIDGLFNRYINQNLQCNLFNYQFMMPLFESKAALNYYVFTRASGDVVISMDRNFLFLKNTVSFDETGSSYMPIPGEEITQLVANFNAIYEHYKKSGFNEVYLSIIPNPVTIIQPEGYNRLIPQIQNDPRLKMKVIDIYSLFKNTSGAYYLAGDTHWNMAGKQKWVDLVNEKLESSSP